jgi:hypothetical protein
MPQEQHDAVILVLAAVLGLAIAAASACVMLWRDLKEYRRMCMSAWIRLDEKEQAQKKDRHERDNLIRRLARAEAAMDGLRSIATEAAMLAQLDALRADSCWAPLHDETTEGVTA